MNQRREELSLNIFDQIDVICQEFRAEWKVAKRPRLEDWFSRVPDPAQPQLFRNLLEAEITYRRRKGESPDSEDFLKRFPQFAQQIRQVFHESTLGSLEIEAERNAPPLDANAQTRTFDSPAANRLGEYELVRELGRGGMGVVYEARHVKRGNRVALKTLPTGSDGQELNADRLHRFRKEFRSLSEINHPNLVGMQSLEVDGAQWFFTMDLIEGEDFLSYVRPQDVLDEARLRDALKQLARGIMALHQRRIIHRDLKPSNVLVERNGRVAILDFGLVAELQKVTDVTQTRSAMFAGTPRYAAPEQMLGQRSEASDWYALGVMLYESLTGELPFTAKNPMELLRQKQEQDPPSLSGRDDLPSDLTELVDALIKRVPSERMGSAAIGARLQLESETRAYGSTGTAGSTGSSGSVADEEDPNFLEPQEEENVLIGRDEQLAQLETARQEMLATRQPVVVWVTGLSGEGKSSLVEKFLRPLRRGTEMLVLSGRCYDRESVPFKAVDCLIDALVSFLRSRKPEQILAWLPDDIAMLARLFPLLLRVPAIADRCGIRSPTIDSKQIRYRGFAALQDLFRNISQSTPIVLFVDDLQWGDADSAEAMFDLLQPPEGPVVLLLGSYRRDEAEDSPFLTAWNRAVARKGEQLVPLVIEIHPLTPEQCLDLVSLRAGIAVGSIREQASELFADSQGNPYFLEQLIEGYDPATGSFRAAPLIEIITCKLQRLPAEAASLLDAIAVAGKSVALAEASQVAGQDKPAYGTITHMRSERLVRLVGAGDQQFVDTYHDKIRESLLHKLDDRTQRNLHLGFGNLIELELASLSEPFDSGDAHADLGENVIQIHPRVPDLAFHFSKAGIAAKAFEYSLRAGRQAQAAYAFAEALTLLKQARAYEPNDSKARESTELAFLLGKAYSGVGCIDESIEQLQLATMYAVSNSNRAAAYYALAQARFRNGDYKVAIDDFYRAFAELGEHLPTSTIGKLFWSMVNMVAIHLAPESLLRWVNRKRNQQLVELSRMYPTFSQLALQLDFYALILGATRSCALAKSQDDMETKCLAYGYYAANLAVGGATGLSRLMIRRSHRFHSESAPSHVQAAEAYHEGSYWYICGELAKAESLLVKAEELFAKIDDWRLYLAVHFLRHLWSVRGQTAKIEEYAWKEYRLAKRSNDEIAIAYGSYALADALSRRGEYKDAVQSAQNAIRILENRNGTFKCIAYQELGRAQLQASNYAEAQTTLSRAVGLVMRLRILEITVPSFPLLVEAILGTEWVNPFESPSRQNQNRARRYARVSRLSGWVFPNNRPHAYRVSGRAACANRKKRKALKYFDKAIAAATKIGAEYELARSLIDKSMLDHPTAAADRQRGLDLLESLGCVLPDAEVEYLGLDRAAHHARAAAARAADVAGDSVGQNTPSPQAASA